MRQLTLATKSSANSIQNLHHRLQVCTRTAPSYLAEMCTPVATSTGHHNLHSATHGDLLVPRTRTITRGSHSSAVCGPCVWNDLPPTLRAASSGTLRQFQYSFVPPTGHDLALL